MLAACAQALGALSPGEELTPLGRHLTLMPLDPRVGKMLVFGALLRCASPVLTVAAAMGHGRQIFFSPADKRQESQARGRQPCVPPVSGIQQIGSLGASSWLSPQR